MLSLGASRGAGWSPRSPQNSDSAAHTAILLFVVVVVVIFIIIIIIMLLGHTEQCSVQLVSEL